MNPPVDHAAPRRRRFSAHARHRAGAPLPDRSSSSSFSRRGNTPPPPSALNAFLFGSPSAIFGFLVQMWQDGSLFTDTKITALETLLGFAIGNVLGTLIGLTLWYSRFVSRVVQPFIIALGSIPIIALAPICIIWFGTGLASKVAMATLSVVVVALITAYKGAMTVDIDQINLMRTLGASKRHIFAKLIVPASLGDIFAGLKLTVGFALIGAIVGEFMSSSEGLGHAIFKAGSLYIIPKVFAALVVTIALALCLTYVVGKIEKLLTPWRQTCMIERRGARHGRIDRCPTTVSNCIRRPDHPQGRRQIRARRDRLLRRRGPRPARSSRSRPSSISAATSSTTSTRSSADPTSPSPSSIRRTGPIRDRRGAKPGDMLIVDVIEVGVRRARLHRAVAGDRHLSRLGPPQGVRHPEPQRRGQGRHRPLERHAQARGQADDRRHRRRPGRRRRAHHRQRHPWRQSRRPGGDQRQPGDVPGLPGGRATSIAATCHALQGDAECNGMGAIEIRGHLRSRVTPRPRAARA